MPSVELEGADPSSDAVMAGNFRGGVFDGCMFRDEYVFMKGSCNYTPAIPDSIQLSNGIAKRTRWVEVESSLKIVDSTHGCTTDGDHHYFILIPREDAIGEKMMGSKQGRMQQELFGVFEQLECKSGSGKCREGNIKRVRMTDGEDSKYVVIGTSPNRAGKGSKESMKGLDHPECVVHKKLFGTWFRRVEYCVEKYLPWYLKDLLGAVGKMCRHGTMPVGEEKKSNIWPAMAVGRNVFLNVHTDEDYFWSLVSVVTNDVPLVDGPVLLYMCFPTLGTAVALRNGDLLMFNPLIPHCVSTRCNDETEVYCLSMYMKSLLVGGSDNDQVLSPNSKEMAEFILTNCTKTKK